MGEQLAHRSGLKGYSKWGNIRLVTSHRWDSTGLRLRPSALQHLHKQLGGKTGRDIDLVGPMWSLNQN